MRAGALLSAPVGWLGVVYLGSLAVMLLAAFWTLDDFSGLTVKKSFSLDNFATIFRGAGVYRTIVWRTVSIAALVTITDILLAFPIALYMAWAAGSRTKRLLVVAVLMPLWASYLVKVYAWRTMFANEGILNWAFEPDRDARAAIGLRARLDRARLPLAAVHGAADLRRAPADPRLDARRLG